MFGLARRIREAGVVGMNARNAEYIMELNQCRLYPLVAYKGVPDIRVPAYKGVPAMAMLRLPTKVSDGKANLHKDGIGAGVEIATGLTTTAVQHDAPAHNHPDTGLPVGGVQVPHRERILHISALTAELSGLGYLGVDIIPRRNSRD